MFQKRIFITLFIFALQALSLNAQAFYAHPYYPQASHAPLVQPHIPISPKNSSTAGALNLGFALVGIGGIGRFYTGDYGIALLQLFLPIIGQIWSFFDGIHILTGHSTDGHCLTLTSHPEYHIPSISNAYGYPFYW